MGLIKEHVQQGMAREGCSVFCVRLKNVDKKKLNTSTLLILCITAAEQGWKQWQFCGQLTLFCDQLTLL